MCDKIKAVLMGLRGKRSEGEKRLDEEILKVLGGKRFALLGFSAKDADLLTWTFDQVQGFCRTLNVESADPTAATFNPYDLVVLYLGDAVAQRAWLQPERLAELDKPLLVIGPTDLLGPYLGLSPSYASDFMTTPMNPAEVVLRSYHILSRAADAPAKDVDEHRRQSVVIADDDATTIALVKAVLQRDGIQCHVARDGGEALKLIGEVMPQAAVLDVNMPHLDGFEVLAAVRNEPRTQAVPVVLLTSRQQESDIVRGFGLGADDYIIKPFSPMELMARVRRLLRSGGHVAN
jgi:CheY-like chemotaxis protein